MSNPLIPLGERFWPLRTDEQREIKKLFQREEVQCLATSLRSRDDKDPIEVLDAAYWMKGCSSLGLLRYAVLVGIGDPPYKGESLYLMDIKEAVRVVGPRYSRARMPPTMRSVWLKARIIFRRILASGCWLPGSSIERSSCANYCHKICRSKSNISPMTKLLRPRGFSLP
jgi:Uncharacterized protein conserved in bacteria (DUF2252)